MMEKLKSIKPLVDIPDYSFYLYLLFILVATTLAAVLVYLLFRVMSRKKISEKEEIKKRLRALDLEDAKKVAYEITRYGRYLVSDESKARLYEDLVKKLTPYKYKKGVPPLSEELKKEIKLFLQVHNE